MDGKIKFVLVTTTTILLCLTILFSLLLIALWQYKLIVGISLLTILLGGACTVCIVALRSNTPEHLPQPSHLPLLKQERTPSPYDSAHY